MIGHPLTKADMASAHNDANEASSPALAAEQRGATALLLEDSCTCRLMSTWKRSGAVRAGAAGRTRPRADHVARFCDANPQRLPSTAPRCAPRQRNARSTMWPPVRQLLAGEPRTARCEPLGGKRALAPPLVTSVVGSARDNSRPPDWAGPGWQAHGASSPSKAPETASASAMAVGRASLAGLCGRCDATVRSVACSAGSGAGHQFKSADRSPSGAKAKHGPCGD